MEQKAAKRFYKEVSCQSTSFEVYLDSRSLKHLRSNRPFAK